MAYCSPDLPDQAAFEPADNGSRDVLELASSLKQLAIVHLCLSMQQASWVDCDKTQATELQKVVSAHLPCAAR